MAWPKFKTSYTRYDLDGAIGQRRKHLSKYLDDYKRVSGILFDRIIDQRSDVGATVYKVQYFPRPRMLQVGISWQRSSYPRSSGFFTLWRDGIFHRYDVESWPKLKCHLDNWPSLRTMSDDDIVQSILTRIGAPWADRFPVPENTGALYHDSAMLLRTIRGLQTIAPPRHEVEAEMLARHIEDFARRVGVE